jgi:transposase-like protein
MASKGQKLKNYSPDFKKEIVNKYFNNEQSYLSLANEYGISKGTIKTWIFKTKNGSNISSDNRGRPKINEEINYKEKYEILKNYQAFLKAQREKK